MEYYNNNTKRKVTEKTCKRCNTKFLARHSKAKFCGVSCKQLYYLENKSNSDLIAELEERRGLVAGLDLLLELHPNDIDIQKQVLLNRGKIMLLENKLKK